MHGPSASLIHPWQDLPQIDFVDSVAPTLEGRKARKWRRARNRALRLWAEVGLEFNKESALAAPAYSTNSPDYPHWVWDDDAHSSGHMAGDEDAFMRGLLVPGAIHLLPMYEGWNGSNVMGMGWLFDTGGFAIFDMTRAFSDVKYLTTHEIGHALGLSHQNERDGGTSASVMYKSDRGYRGWSEAPDLHDRESLRTYYGL